MTDTATVAMKAHQRAQRRFHEMVVAASYGDPNDRRTRLYVEAERLLNRLNVESPEWYLDARHDAAIAEMDELADQDLAVFLPDVPLAFYTEAEARFAWGDR